MNPKLRLRVSFLPVDLSVPTTAVPDRHRGVPVCPEDPSGSGSRQTVPGGPCPGCPTPPVRRVVLPVREQEFRKGETAGQKKKKIIPVSK